MRKSNIGSVAILFIASFLLIAFNGCKNDCSDLDCKNGSECVDGKCDCPEGYAGDECENAQPSLSGGYNCDGVGNCSYVDASAEYTSLAACTVGCQEESSSTAGYDCNQAGDCQFVSSNAEYPTLIDCENSCTPSGYNCVSGDCVWVESNPEHATLLDCQSQSGCLAYGSVIIWRGDSFPPPAFCSVYFSAELLGETQSIIDAYTDGIPSCGTVGSANFEDVPVGEYTMTVSCNGEVIWYLDVSVQANQCTEIKLY